MYLCLHATDMPIFSATYWILFVLISALVVLSLFIGSVTMSMSEQMKEMREEEERLEAEAAELKAANKLLEAAKEAEKQKAAEPASAEASTRRRGLREREEHQRQLEMQKLLLELVQDDGAAHVTTTLDDETPAPACVAAYSKLAELSKRAVEHPKFVNLVTGVILLAGVMVGVQTDNTIMDETAIGRHPAADDEDDPKNACDPSGRGLRAALLGRGHHGHLHPRARAQVPRGEFEPWRALYRLNKFDLVVVLGCSSRGRQPATMLRLLRLLRVLKLVKSLLQLAVIVDALIMGFSSIGFIGLILLVFFYFFAIVGVEFFGDNDPWHFGTFHVAMLTLFRVHGEDWTDVCTSTSTAANGTARPACTTRRLGPARRAVRLRAGPHERVRGVLLHHLLHHGSLVLLSSFIGRITTAMEEAQYDRRGEGVTRRSPLQPPRRASDATAKCTRTSSTSSTSTAAARSRRTSCTRRSRASARRSRRTSCTRSWSRSTRTATARSTCSSGSCSS